MKLTKITNIEALNAEQSVNVKGGARDTRSGSTGTIAPVIGLSPTPAPTPKKG